MFLLQTLTSHKHFYEETEIVIPETTLNLVTHEIGKMMHMTLGKIEKIALVGSITYIW